MGGENLRERKRERSRDRERRGEYQHKPWLLKAKFGTGYQLAFNCAPGRVGDVESFVRNNLRKAVHIETYAGT